MLTGIFISSMHFLGIYYPKRYLRFKNGVIFVKEANYSWPIEATLGLIGGKYKAIILHHLTGKTLRFSELTRLVPTATPKMLTQQLRELESCNLIVRVVYPVVPPKVEYSLSDLGQTMIPLLKSMCEWGDSYLKMRNG